MIKCYALSFLRLSMPIYEYQCTACGHQLEAMQKMSDPALTKCPVCGKTTLIKLVSAAGFQLKGTGWYATDFRNKPKANEQSEKKETDTKKAPSEANKSTEGSNKTSNANTSGESK